MSDFTNDAADASLKRADLHCHSRFSVFKYFRRANTRDCYNAPEDVYRIAKARGMAYVCLTDHDSIDGALYLLNKHPEMTDFFIGEEVETYFPETGQRIHVGVWGLDEAQHREIQRLRPNIRELIPYMKSQRLIFGINHLFQNYRMKNVAGLYIAELLEMFDIFEVLNGAMASFHNRMVQQLVDTVKQHGRRISMVGGADLLSTSYTAADKTIQLAARLASIPTAISGIPAAITSLNYLKQILVTKGISMRFEKLVEEIRPGLG